MQCVYIANINLFLGKKKRLAAAAAEAIWIPGNQRVLHFSTSKVSSLNWLKPYWRTPSKVCDT